MKPLIAIIREIWQFICDFWRSFWEFDDPMAVCWKHLIRETRRRQQARQAKWAPPTEQEFRALVQLKWANQAMEDIQTNQLQRRRGSAGL